MPLRSRMSSTELWSMTCPLLMNTTSSSAFSTSEMRWVEMMMDEPPSKLRSMVSSMKSRVAGSTPPIGSSSR